MKTATGPAQLAFCRRSTDRLEAEDEAQAIAKLFQSEAEPVCETEDFIEIAADYGLPTDENRDLADQLRALGVQVGEAVIPSIRSIKRVE